MVSGNITPNKKLVIVVNSDYSGTIEVYMGEGVNKESVANIYKPQSGQRYEYCKLNGSVSVCTHGGVGCDATVYAI